MSNSLQLHRVVACQASLSLTHSWSLLKLIFIESVMPSNHLTSSVISFFSCLQSFPALGTLLTNWTNESVPCIGRSKYWSFHFCISPSNEYSGLISFRIDWFDLLAVKGTLKSLLQHHSSKASILRCSAFFMVQLSHPYVTNGKAIALTIRNFYSMKRQKDTTLKSLNTQQMFSGKTGWTILTRLLYFVFPWSL